jgi:hypothetical protein
MTKCPHGNILVVDSDQIHEPPCGCRFTLGTTPVDPHPTPWAVRSLMIVDAKSATVLHLGGQQSVMGVREPKDLVRLNKRIVRSVNAIDKAVEAFKALDGLFSTEDPRFIIHKIKGGITNGEQDEIDAAFSKLKIAMAEATP